MYVAMPPVPFLVPAGEARGSYVRVPPDVRPFFILPRLKGRQERCRAGAASGSIPVAPLLLVGERLSERGRGNQIVYRLAPDIAVPVQGADSLASVL